MFDLTHTHTYTHTHTHTHTQRFQSDGDYFSRQTRLSTLPCLNGPLHSSTGQQRSFKDSVISVYSLRNRLPSSENPVKDHTNPFFFFLNPFECHNGLQTSHEVLFVIIIILEPSQWTLLPPLRRLHGDTAHLQGPQPWAFVQSHAQDALLT